MTDSNMNVERRGRHVLDPDSAADGEPAEDQASGSASHSGRVSEENESTDGQPALKSKAVPHFTRAERAARARRRGRRCRVRRRQRSIFPSAVTRSRCLRNRQSRGWLSWCRSATAGCWCRRLRSTVAAALIMAADLARTPNSGLRVQLCGDAHLSNFGVFGSPERNLVFDINDFDETAPGPWEWDVKRLAASFAIGGPRERLLRKGATQRLCSTPCAHTGRR